MLTWFYDVLGRGGDMTQWDQWDEKTRLKDGVGCKKVGTRFTSKWKDAWIWSLLSKGLSEGFSFWKKRNTVPQNWHGIPCHFRLPLSQDLLKILFDKDDPLETYPFLRISRYWGSRFVHDNLVEIEEDCRAGCKSNFMKSILVAFGRYRWKCRSWSNFTSCVQDCCGPSFFCSKTSTCDVACFFVHSALEKGKFQPYFSFDSFLLVCFQKCSSFFL